MLSPPTWVVWIEILTFTSNADTINRSPPTWVVWIEIYAWSVGVDYSNGHHPHGWCGLKSDGIGYTLKRNVSPPTWVVWIEIVIVFKIIHTAESPPTWVVWIEINSPGDKEQ